MTTRQDRETLLLRYLDGALSESEKRELEAWLRGDPEARAWLREIAEQAVAMGDLARTRELQAPQVVREERFHFPNVSWLALAACLVVLGVVAAWWLHPSTRALPMLVEVVELDGPMSWSGADAEWRHTLSRGERLPAGTLQADGEGATAQIRFDDGSVITLGGESELSFHEQDHQKRLWLRRGSMSAQVQPQPKGRPMLVRTATAEAEVVGTVFSLSARPDDTLLTVDQGLVKLKRLTDGHSIDVPAQSSALARLDDAEKLGASSTPPALAEWRFDFANTVPPARWRGVWNSTPEGGRMVASPYVAGRRADLRTTTHFGVSVRAAYLDPPLKLQARDDSVIRYRLKQDIPAPLQVMLLTSKNGGGYGGNFECRLSVNDLHPDPDGWCDVVVPLSEFKPVDPRKNVRVDHPTAVGNILDCVLLSSFQEDTKLTVSSFELLSASSR